MLLLVVVVDVDVAAADEAWWMRAFKSRSDSSEVNKKGNPSAYAVSNPSAYLIYDGDDDRDGDDGGGGDGGKRKENKLNTQYPKKKKKKKEEEEEEEEGGRLSVALVLLLWTGWARPRPSERRQC